MTLHPLLTLFKQSSHLFPSLSVLLSLLASLKGAKDFFQKIKVSGYIYDIFNIVRKRFTHYKINFLSKNNKSCISLMAIVGIEDDTSASAAVWEWLWCSSHSSPLDFLKLLTCVMLIDTTQIFVPAHTTHSCCTYDFFFFFIFFFGKSWKQKTSKCSPGNWLVFCTDWHWDD